MNINARHTVICGVHRTNVHGPCQTFHAFKAVIPSVKHQPIMGWTVRKRRESLSLFQRIRIEKHAVVIVEVDILGYCTPSARLNRLNGADKAIREHKRLGRPALGADRIGYRYKVRLIDRILVCHVRNSPPVHWAKPRERRIRSAPDRPQSSNPLRARVYNRLHQQGLGCPAGR